LSSMDSIQSDEALSLQTQSKLKCASAITSSLNVSKGRTSEKDK